MGPRSHYQVATYLQTALRESNENTALAFPEGHTSVMRSKQSWTTEAAAQPLFLSKSRGLMNLSSA